jgi:predicted dehydrogenase
VVTASLRFASGALGVIEATTAGFPGSLKRIELTGSQGTAILEEEDIIKWEFAQTNEDDQRLREEMKGRTKTGGGAADPAAIGHHAHTALFRDFLLAIQQNQVSAIDGHQGRRSVELILAIYESARTGQKVRLPATISNG